MNAHIEYLKQTLGKYLPIDEEAHAMLLAVHAIEHQIAQQFAAHDGVLHSNATLRAIIDKQALQINKLEAQIHDEGAGKA